jgi:hypothetical protein
MKRVGIITTALLSFLLITMASAYAQHEQEGKEHEKSPQAQEHQKAQPAQHPQPAREQGKPHPSQQQRPAAQSHSQARQPAQQQHEAQHQQPVQHQARPQQSHNGPHPGNQPHGPTHASVRHNDSPQHQQQARRGFVQARARSWDHDHRTWGQRGGYHGYRVPQDRFSLYFGSSHNFRIYSLPFVFVSGHPRFQYNNYQVTLVDPWPETWPEDWYQTDDTYLDYNGDGYYLYNRSRPGPAIAVSIAL